MSARAHGAGEEPERTLPVRTEDVPGERQGDPRLDEAAEAGRHVLDRARSCERVDDLIRHERGARLDALGADGRPHGGDVVDVRT